MTQTVELPDALFRRLQALAEPLVDTTVDVIEQAVDCLEHNSRPAMRVMSPSSPKPSPSLPIDRRIETVESRAPRERGVNASVDGQLIRAHSVRDLYEQTLRYLVDSDRIAELRPYIPYKTSNQRYLISDQPVHPSGNPFVVPIAYGRLHMETHKSYQTAFKQLAQFLGKADIEVRYHG